MFDLKRPAPKRLLLDLDPATQEYLLPCGCPLHYFDGRPRVAAPEPGDPDLRSILVGIIQPHVQVKQGCPFHDLKAAQEILLQHAALNSESGAGMCQCEYCLKLRPLVEKYLP